MTEESIVFSWDYEEVEKYVVARLNCEDCQIAINTARDLKKKLRHDPQILEAGSGNGCVVIIFDRLGFKNIRGVELNSSIVKSLNHAYPKLQITHGNILHLDNNLKDNDFVMSFGVVEHFIDGPSKPIKAMYDAVKNGGYAVISVPCLNFFRKLKKLLDKKTKRIMKESGIKFAYHPWFLEGKFYEYHLSVREFKKECEKAGFKILRHHLSQINLGIMLFLNPNNKKGRFIWYEKLEDYQYSFLGKIIYNIAKIFPFLFCHFQICLLKKEE